MSIVPPERPKNKFIIGFAVDSGLVFDLVPTQIRVSPFMAGYSPSEWQHSISKPPIIKRGERTDVYRSTQIGIQDSDLVSRIEGIRSGGQVERGLIIELQFEDDRPIELKALFGISNS